MNNPNPQPIYVNNPVINPVNAYTMQPIISQTSAGDVVYFNNNRAISSTSQIQSKVAPALPVATPQLVNQIQPVKQNVVMAQHPIQQQHMQTIQQQQIQPSQMFVTTPYTVPTYVVNNANGKNMIQTQPYQQQIPIPQSYQQQMPIPQSYQQQMPIPQSYQQQIPIPQSYQQQIPIPQSYQQQIPIQQPYQQPIPIPQPYQQRIQNQSQNRSLNQPPY
ncbi:dentin sialophosphoprotein-like [Gigaspora margarita]|nr:dentin sialophosphoprotein-like [Gigaspora margarita]